MTFINDDIRGYYAAEQVSHRMPKLKLSNLFKDGFPELHGQGVKAANTRALAPYIRHLQRRATALDASATNKPALEVIESVQDAIDVMYGGGYFLTDDEVKKLVQIIGANGTDYQVLALAAVDAKELAW